MGKVVVAVVARRFTDGRTAGGGTGNTWHIIHSGLDHVELNP
jgi:hypothetical protein